MIPKLCYLAYRHDVTRNEYVLTCIIVRSGSERSRTIF
jgi:hypothetical protein